jgi:hypothetical protein
VIGIAVITEMGCGVMIMNNDTDETWKWSWIILKYDRRFYLEELRKDTKARIGIWSTHKNARLPVKTNIVLWVLKVVCYFSWVLYLWRSVMSQNIVINTASVFSFKKSHQEMYFLWKVSPNGSLIVIKIIQIHKWK